MTRLRISRLGLFAAFLALTVQFAFGATVPDPTLGEAGFGIICHAGHDNGSGHARRDRHAPD
ncbi:MAG: hypothetical protein M3Y41_18670, partial [Pseudomonadota bacterium]|nr:hypothetical protein [Pseudomonadota bacterium]